MADQLAPYDGTQTRHVEGYLVIPRTATIEHLQEQYVQFQSTLTMVERMYERYRPRSHLSEDESGVALNFCDLRDVLLKILQKFTWDEREHVLVGG